MSYTARSKHHEAVAALLAQVPQRKGTDWEVVILYYACLTSLRAYLGLFRKHLDRSRREIKRALEPDHEAAKTIIQVHPAFVTIVGQWSKLLEHTNDARYSREYTPPTPEEMPEYENAAQEVLKAIAIARQDYPATPENAVHLETAANGL